MIEELNLIFIKLEKIQGQVDRNEKSIDRSRDVLTKIALIEDSVLDLEKSFEAGEIRASKEKQKSTAMLICILSCIAAIVAAVLQGVLTGTF